jgi:ankyrin repeat protein
MLLRPRNDRRLSLFRALLLIVACVAAIPASAATREEDFAIAVANDRVGQVKDMLARGVDPNTVDAQGDPALVVAARSGNLNTVQVLLAAKADVNARNRFGDTAIMVAALSGSLPVVGAVGARGAPISRTRVGRR